MSSTTHEPPVSLWKKGVQKLRSMLSSGAAAKRTFTSSEDYWEQRYAEGGDSGVGSYGKFREFQASFLNDFVARNGIRTVIELGCGDGSQLELAEYPTYTGCADRLFPGMKVVLVVRHPVERMWSALGRHWTFSYLPNVADVGQDLASMLAFADRRLNDAYGDYDRIHWKWSRVVGTRLLTVRFDDFRRDYARTMRRILEFIGVDSDLDFFASKETNRAGVPNRTKVNVEMPEYFRFYLSRRYEERTRRFDERTGGMVRDWVEDIERCVGEGSQKWHQAYRLRHALRYLPVHWAHRLGDPLRMRWKNAGLRCEASAS